MSHLDPDSPLYVADVTCPNCGAANHVAQVQGDRCCRCGLEFKLFTTDEELMAREFYDCIAGRRFLGEIPGWGFVLAHE